MPKTEIGESRYHLFSVELLRNVDKIGVAGTLKCAAHINDSVSLMLIAAELDTADFRHARAVIFY